MNIRQINCNNITNFTFSGSARNVYDRYGNYIATNTTISFREDFNWIEFAKEIGKYYKNVDKVHVFDYACSTGEEAFTIIMSLFVALGEECRKFFKVIAKDIDSRNIADAKSGIISVHDDEEYKYITKNTQSLTNNFLKYNKDGENIKFRPLVRKNVIFSQANILDDIDNLPERNTILFCRNLLLYFNDYDETRLLTKIANKFKDTSSILVLGDGDTNKETRNLLSELGFVQFNDIKNAYIKKYSRGKCVRLF